MKSLTIAAAVTAVLALAACTKAEQQDTAADVKAAAQEVGDTAKDAVSGPEVKKLGEEMKDAAGDAVDVTKGALKGAAEGAKEGAQDAKAAAKGDEK